jgi:glycosyltransferase involved in cell wall biosynthesis
MKLSVITINFNNAEGLRKTVESVVNQTFTDYEYIVIDGGSTDGSLDIIRQYSDSISCWTSEPDSGIYNALNKGIKAAKGEYCLFMNSGDTIYSDSVLQKVFDLNPRCDIINGNMLKQFPDGKTRLDKGSLYERWKKKQQLTLYDFYRGCNLNHQATFIKRDLFEKYGLYDEKYRVVADWKFFMQTIVICGASAKYVDITVSRFDMSGLSNADKGFNAAEREKILKELFPETILDDYRELKRLKHSLTYLIASFIKLAVEKIINRLKG